MKNDNLEQTLTIVSEICDRYIDSMQDGDRTTFAELTDKISTEIQLSKSTISSLIRIYTNNNPKIEVSTGRNGGIFKGKKAQKLDLRPRCLSCGQTIKHSFGGIK